MRLCLTICLVFVGLFLTACGGDSTGEETLVALQATRGTQMAFVRGTATYEADRRAVTLEFLATAGTRAALRQREIVSTLNALGIDTSNIGRITPQATATPVISEQSGDGFARGGGITRIAPTGQLRTPLPTATALPPTLDPDAPALTNVVLAADVGSDDCATNVTNEFTTSEDQIYVVMVANRLTAGNTVVSRWVKDDEEVAVYDFVRDFDVDGACIWFFVDQTDFAFTAGSTYSVTLELNGVPAVDPIPFTIVEPS